MLAGSSELNQPLATSDAIDGTVPNIKIAGVRRAALAARARVGGRAWRGCTLLPCCGVEAGKTRRAQRVRGDAVARGTQGTHVLAPG